MWTRNTCQFMKDSEDHEDLFGLCSPAFVQLLDERVAAFAALSSAVVSPASPVSEINPPGVASPKAWVSRSTSPQVRRRPWARSPNHPAKKTVANSKNTDELKSKSVSGDAVWSCSGPVGGSSACRRPRNRAAGRRWCLAARGAAIRRHATGSCFGPGGELFAPRLRRLEGDAA